MNQSEFSNIAQGVIIDPKAKLNHPVHFGKFVEIHAFTDIGSFTFINQYSVVYGRVKIGKFSIVARNCEIGVANHPIDWLSSMGNIKPYFPRHPDMKSSEHFPTIAHHPTLIGNDVWIGCGVTIKTGVTIGDGAVIAAGAVVSCDIEPYAVYGGIPAKLIKYRFDAETIAELLSIQWWDLDTKVIAQLPRNNVQASIEMVKAWKCQKNTDSQLDPESCVKTKQHGPVGN